MRRTSLALIAAAAVAMLGMSVPAHAVPPTVTPSPGYDARLQEQRATQQRSHVEPTLKPPPKRRGKRSSAH